MPNEILKTEKLASKTEFAVFFKNMNKNPGGFRGAVLNMIPEKEVMVIKAPVDKNGFVIWKNISLPWTEAKKRKLKILTHRSQYKGKPALFVGIKKA
jgi:hypothetical protein